MLGSISFKDRDTRRAIGEESSPIVMEGSHCWSCPETKIKIVWKGRPSWRSGRDDRTSKEESFRGALINGYRKHGTDVLKFITGEFAVVIVDSLHRRALLAVDRNGITTLFYSAVNGLLTYGSTADITAAKAGRTEVNPQAIYDYAYFHVVPAPISIYKGVYRLLPGQCLTIDGDRIQTTFYWNAQYYDSPRTKISLDLKREFNMLLRQCVSEAVGDKQVGTFLSGGTDSSTITGILSQCIDTPVRSYSIGFGADGYDEMEFARIAARRFQVEHKEYYLSPEDVVTGIPKLASYYDQPFGNASAVPAYYCAKLARHDGVERLLAGDGGDELFGGNERYAKQNLFSSYGRVPVVLRKRLIEPIVSGIPFGDRLAAICKIRSYIHQANTAMPERMEFYNLLNRIGAENVFTSEFLADVDTSQPLTWLRETYDNAGTQNMVNRMLAVDMRFILADSDLPKVSGMCRLAGIEVAYPLLNDAMVEFAARLPPELKVRGTKLRYFFKHALRDFLPREVLTKRKHGFGLPFGVWMTTHKQLRELAFDSLEALKLRGWVRPSFSDKLTRQYYVEHAAYYGTFIWVLMMLEQWLQNHDYAKSEKSPRIGMNGSLSVHSDTNRVPKQAI